MDALLSNFSAIGNAIGWSLIHFIWQGTLLFIAYWVITRFFLRNKINLQYWVGIAFILLCLIVPIREFFLQLGLSSNTSIIHQLGISIAAVESNGILNPLDLFIAVIQKLIPYLVLFWLAMVTLISAHLAKSWFMLKKLSRASSTQIPDYLLNKLNKISKKLQLRFKPIISISKKIDIPATFGYFKPIILLPTSLINRLPQDQMEAILMHEMCHIKRADFLHNIIQLLVETLFFYHPLSKWISRDVRRIREQCCDELVLELNTNPLVYAKALTNIATIYNNYCKNNTSSPIQIAATDGELLNRIKFLMLEKRTKSPMVNTSFALLLSALLLFVFNNLNKDGLTIENTINALMNSGSENLIANQKFIKKPAYTLPNINQLIQQQQATINQAKKKEKSIAIQANNIEIPVSNQIIDKLAIISEKQNLPSPALSLEKNLEQTTVASETKTNTIPVANNPSQAVDSIKAENTYPRLIKRVNPIYKRSYRSQGIEGTVILSFDINEKGRVKNIKVDKSSPLKLLDGSARLALHKWRFDPETINQNNIDNRYQQIFSFTLGNEVNSCKAEDIVSRLHTSNLCQDL